MLKWDIKDALVYTIKNEEWHEVGIWISTNLTKVKWGFWGDEFGHWGVDGDGPASFTRWPPGGHTAAILLLIMSLWDPAFRHQSHRSSCTTVSEWRWVPATGALLLRTDPGSPRQEQCRPPLCPLVSPADPKKEVRVGSGPSEDAAVRDFAQGQTPLCPFFSLETTHLKVHFITSVLPSYFSQTSLTKHSQG